MGFEFVRIGDLFLGHVHLSLLGDVEVKVKNVSFVNEREFYIHKPKGKPLSVAKHDKNIYIGAAKNAVDDDERMNYMFCAKSNHPKTDARWFTKTKERKLVLVVIKYKYTRTDSEPESTPIKWYESFANEISRAFPGFQIIYVYITNANIEKHSKEAISSYPGEIIIVDESIASNYFAPTILPFFTFADPIDDTRKV